MKRILIFLAIAGSLVAFTGCIVEHDYVYTSEYIYKNESSRTITVSSHSPYQTIDGEYIEGRNSIFTIETGDEYLTKLGSGMGGPFVGPLHWTTTTLDRDGDYTVVSNGVSEFTHYYKDNDDLYNLEKYELISESEYKRTYAYTFRDGDFESISNSLNY